jgi:pimeloyl-ACP methyl ester carboxylesterase
MTRPHVNHVRRGEGEPLVLLHGIGHRWQAWLPVLPLLAAYHEVIAVDLPGFGASPVPPGGMPRDMPATVAGVVSFLADIGVKRPHVAGSSLGGAIALELAAAGLARSATALAPAGFFTPAERRRALLILRALRASTFLPSMLIRQTMRSERLRVFCFGPIVAQPRRLDHERAVGDAHAMRLGRGFNAVARAARDYRFQGSPSVPVTVAWGAKDRVLRPHQAERAKQHLPSARHVLLPACGHVPMSDDPEAVATLILATTGAISADTPTRATSA